MSEIDLRPGMRDFTVTTVVERNGTDYMGPEVRVLARDSEHAKQVAQSAGHRVNPHFPPRENKKW